VLQQNDHFHEQILLLALEGASDDLFALMTRPASEKTRFDGALIVAGTARTDLASAANFRNVEVCCLHHFSISSDVDDRQRNCSISRSLFPLSAACRANMPRRARFQLDWECSFRLIY